MLETTTNDQRSLVTIPISPGKAWDTIKELLTGYNRRAQERGERAIAESIPATRTGLTPAEQQRAYKHEDPPWPRLRSHPHSAGRTKPVDNYIIACNARRVL